MQTHLQEKFVKFSDHYTFSKWIELTTKRQSDSRNFPKTAPLVRDDEQVLRSMIVIFLFILGRPYGKTICQDVAGKSII